MGITELILISIGLAMDAFAVSICKGIKMTSKKNWHIIVIALFFGGFQMLMPIIGWFLGSRFESYITSFDHWIAFILLLIIGGKMIFESFKKDSDDEELVTKFDVKEIFVLAIATSIDALAVGITFAFLKVNIMLASSLIGSITFILAIVGVLIGSVVGGKFKNKAELLGGIILILIGVKILLEHLGVIHF